MAVKNSVFKYKCSDTITSTAKFPKAHYTIIIIIIIIIAHYYYYYYYCSLLLSVVVVSYLNLIKITITIACSAILCGLLDTNVIRVGIKFSSKIT